MLEVKNNIIMKLKKKRFIREKKYKNNPKILFVVNVVTEKDKENQKTLNPFL